MTKAKTVNPTAQRRFAVTYTKRQYKDAVRAAYRLGRQDGEQRRYETVVAMQTANKHLVAELVRLDHDVPLDSVTITVRLAESIEKILVTHSEQHCLGLLRERMQTVGGNIKDLVKRSEQAVQNRSG